MELWIEQDGAVERRALADGEHRVGEADRIPAELGLTLFVEGGRLSIEARAPVRVGGILLPAKLRRLVVPGEPIEPVPGRVFRVRPEVADAAPATRAVVRSLLEPGSTPASASLVALTGPDAGRMIPLAGRPVVVGRGDLADVRLRDQAISRRHARISASGDAHAVEDLGTANGVFVNGARIWGTHPLEDGFLIEFGRTLLRYCSGQAAEAERRSERSGAPARPSDAERGEGIAEGGADPEKPGDAASSDGAEAHASSGNSGSSEREGTAGAQGRHAPEDGGGSPSEHADSGHSKGPSEAEDGKRAADEATGAGFLGMNASNEAPGARAEGATSEAGRHEVGVSAVDGAERRRDNFLIASGAVIVAVGLALTLGCLRLGASPEVSSPASTAVTSLR